MSDSVSTASQTIASQLTGTSSNLSSMFGNGNPNNCMASNIRFFFWMISVLCLLCLCFVMLSNVMVACSDNNQDVQDTLQYIPAQQRPVRRRQCGSRKQIEGFHNTSGRENFSNDIMYSYKHSATSNYQNIALTAPDTINKTPANLVFGEAHRYVTSENDQVELRLDISANLYVLDGNILNQTSEKVKHSYQAYLVNNKREISIGALKREGDGLYKLKFETKKPNELLTARGVIIKYEIDNESVVLLTGTFD
ncbi:MAG: hypothetical protein EBU90_04750 [Proteobacteria bacterium]|nr:hypothetical protein [Pseudomonadota bacterium]NBP13773.1 hypothetical protein [bacterium]